MNKDIFKRIELMDKDLSKGPREVLPSKYWIALNKKNLQQLKTSGYEHFKRTLALNYFTWVGPDVIWQLIVLFIRVRKTAFIKSLFGSLIHARHKGLSLFSSFLYTFITYALWDYIRDVIPEKKYASITEPLVGDPFRVFRHKKLISQDLANSLLEYDSITKKIDMRKVTSIMELGAGYGRVAHVFLHFHKDIRYIVVDIAPALAITEYYLSSLYPKKRIFYWRSCADYSDIKNEYEAADIVFLTPNQLELLPSKSVDLFITISSIHEMRRDQIDYYFVHVDRLVRGFFYTKQWKVSRIPYENSIIRRLDYPVRKNWKTIFDTSCKIQVAFFEALYKIL